MERAFDVLDVRSVNEAERTFIGIANSGRLDSHRTIIDPNGAEFELPIPLFYHERGQHTQLPFGNIIRTWVENGKRWVEAHVPKVDDTTAGGRSVRDRLDAAWAEVKSGLVRGLSLDFIPLDPPHARPGTTVKRWAFRGLTVVPIPSNMDTSIMSVRSAFAASGDLNSRSPGVSGTPTNSPRRKMSLTNQEMISQHESSVASKLQLRDAITAKAGEEGRSLGADEQESWDTLDAEIDGHTDMLTRLRKTKADMEARAVPVNGASIAAASQTRGGVAVVTVKPVIDPGIAAAQYVMSLAACNGNRHEAAQYARATFGDAAEEVSARLMTRAAIAPGTTVQATFAAPLVQTNFLNDFLELLRPQTIIGRMPGLRRVPFNISMPSQTAGGTYKWVGEGKYKPVTNAQFAAVTLGMAKASGIIVLTDELVRSSAPSAQEVIRDELQKGITQFLDGQFIDPAIAAVANVNPASITNGVAGTAAGGTTEAFARSDLRALLGGFVTGNFGLGGVVLLMNEGVAFTLATLVNAVGEVAFPGMSATGGSILGIPVVTSNVITNDIFAVHAPSILVADEGGVEIDISREASLQMDSAPTDPPVDATVHVSLWQANLVALRAERYINWGKARTGAVRRTHTVAYV